MRSDFVGVPFKAYATKEEVIEGKETRLELSMFPFRWARMSEDMGVKRAFITRYKRSFDLVLGEPDQKENVCVAYVARKTGRDANVSKCCFGRHDCKE